MAKKKISFTGDTPDTPSVGLFSSDTAKEPIPDIRNKGSIDDPNNSDQMAQPSGKGSGKNGVKVAVWMKKPDGSTYATAGTLMPDGSMKLDQPGAADDDLLRNEEGQIRFSALNGDNSSLPAQLNGFNLRNWMVVNDGSEKTAAAEGGF